MTLSLFTELPVSMDPWMYRWYINVDWEDLLALRSKIQTRQTPCRIMAAALQHYQGSIRKPHESNSNRKKKLQSLGRKMDPVRDAGWSVTLTSSIQRRPLDLKWRCVERGARLWIADGDVARSRGTVLWGKPQGFTLKQLQAQHSTLHSPIAACQQHSREVGRVVGRCELNQTFFQPRVPSGHYVIF